jgi:hypothetical protein
MSRIHCDRHYGSIQLVRKDVVVNEYERLSNITLTHKLKLQNRVFIVIVNVPVTEGSSTNRIYIP